MFLSKFACLTIASAGLLVLAVSVVSAQPPDSALRAYEQKLPHSSVSFKMIPIAGGSYTMGSPGGQRGRKTDEGPAAKVRIDPFFIEEHETTYDEYILFADESLDTGAVVDGITRPSPPYIDFTLGMGKTGGFPANSMSQYAALMYCKWLYKKTGIFYRLPSEAEWEYACRAGSAAAYPFGEQDENLGKYGWFSGNSGGRYHAVMQLQPNAWGLYDMLGNVAEWTLDQYHDNYYVKIQANTSSPANPILTPGAKYPITLRGGSYRDEATGLRAAARLASDRKWNARDPQIPRSKWWNTDAPFIGFRVVRPLKQPDSAAVDQFFAQWMSIK